MKRLLTAGIFGTILGIVGAGTANASIVSSGFLDEKLTEYALSTSLDLKANQSDFTELNTQINHACNSVGSGFYDLNYQFSTARPQSDFPKNIAEIGDAIAMTMDIIGSKMLDGWIDPFSSKIYRGLRSLNDGWKDTDGTTYLGVKDLNTKIGDLPTEYATVGAALTAIKGIAEDAKAAALAAIPDPKQEGSSGKFVLTVDIVGDNATYHWEKIDREGETTTE